MSSEELKKAAKFMEKLSLVQPFVDFLIALVSVSAMIGFVFLFVYCVAL